MVIVSLSHAEVLGTHIQANLLADVYREVTRQLTEEYLKEHSAEVLSKIDMKKLSNQIKNQISLETVRNLTAPKITQQVVPEKEVCTLGCPSNAENIRRRRLRGNAHKRTGPVKPEVCYERKHYKCRLIDK